MEVKINLKIQKQKKNIDQIQGGFQNMQINQNSGHQNHQIQMNFNNINNPERNFYC